jgi:hypothetical protein
MSEFFSFYSNLLRNLMMKEKAEKVAVKRNIALSFLSRLGLYLSNMCNFFASFLSASLRKGTHFWQSITYIGLSLSILSLFLRHRSGYMNATLNVKLCCNTPELIEFRFKSIS